ncbi:MAG: DNA replication/repair protein RecF [Rhodobacteraceae bacterium]|nr:DNA replication/repair protein RecF [Paracoccaceae bacterium]
MSALFLSSVTLSHFRSHKRIALEADARPVAIYGRNGVGKTNLLEAVSLFSPGRGMRRATAEQIARRPEALGWKITGLLNRGSTQHELASQSENTAARTVRIDGKAATQSELGHLLRVLWLVPSMDRLWIEGTEGRRRFLDRMTLSFTPAHADVSLAYEKAMRERNRLLKDQVRDSHWYLALETQMAEAGIRVQANRMAALARLATAQQNAETSFPAAALTLSQPETHLPDTAAELRQAFADGRRQDLAAGRTLIGPHRCDLSGVYTAKGVSAKECSTGEQKALLISLILANARALAEDLGMAPIILLDEVAAHLDADRRAALYDEICALGSQAWMTGTGTELFEQLGNRAQYVEVTETSGMSAVARKEA